MKKCSKCKIEKELTDFSIDRQGKDSRRCRCRDCDRNYRQAHRKEAAKYYQSRKEKMRIYHRKYCRTEVNKASQARRQKKCRITISGHLRSIFASMKQRCGNPKNESYKHYGGRGIQVYFKSADEFINYVVNKLQVDPRGLTIDRIDNDGNYERGNIQFIAQAENNKNKRSYENRLNK